VSSATSPAARPRPKKRREFISENNAQNARRSRFSF
jgi:hypothetical protein